MVAHAGLFVGLVRAASANLKIALSAYVLLGAEYCPKHFAELSLAVVAALLVFRRDQRVQLLGVQLR